jgi:hypothetical protein
MTEMSDKAWEDYREKAAGILIYQKQYYQAAGLDANVAERFFLSKFNENPHFFIHDKDALTVGRLKMNRYAYILANMDTPGAKAFRRKYAEQLVECAMEAWRVEHCKFLYLDGGNGEGPLGKEFRLQMEGLLEKDSLHLTSKEEDWKDLHEANKRLNSLKAYLNKLDDRTTWRMYRTVILFQFRVHEYSALAFLHIPQRHCLPLLRSVRDEVQDNASTTMLAALQGEEIADELIRYFPPMRYSYKNASKYDRGMDVFKALVKHPQPKVRLILLRAIEAMPTPQRIEFLAKLESDPDPGVQTAAKKLRVELETKKKKGAAK